MVFEMMTFEILKFDRSSDFIHDRLRYTSKSSSGSMDVKLWGKRFFQYTLYECFEKKLQFCNHQRNETHIFACSQQDSADSGVRRRYGDDVRYQRLDEDLLKDELGEEHQDTFILICGTKSFDKDMVNYLRRLGVPEPNYFRF